VSEAAGDDAALASAIGGVAVAVGVVPGDDAARALSL
jgi:hypothetical protein